MSDIKLFRIKNGIKQLTSNEVALEKELQNIIENNMDSFFGVKFLATEYVTNNGGRMDSIGIDENHCPVIFEYKRSKNENVINQGLFYLDWLLNHKDSFKLLVLEKLDKEEAANIDWSMPRVICIASDFNKYDESAINQMNRNISLIKYKKFDDDLLLFDLMNQNIVKPIYEENNALSSESKKNSNTSQTFDKYFEQSGKQRQELYEEIRRYILDLGDDVTENKLKLYVAFKKIKNFACVLVYQKNIQLDLSLNPKEIELVDDFIVDMTNKGHWGTGNVEVYIRNKEEFEIVKPLIKKAYEEN